MDVTAIRKMVDGPNSTSLNCEHECDACKDTGFINHEKDGYLFGVECNCQGMKRSGRMIEKSGLKHLLDRCTLNTFEAQEPWQQVAKARAREFVNDTENEWFYVGGAVGSGKTHICTAIVGELIKQGRAARYMLWRDDSVRIKASVNDEEGYYEAVNPLKIVEVLYIDDFFKTQKGRDVTGGDVNLAFEIINYRYNNPGSITLISSERTIDEIMDIDQAVGSRIYQKAGKYRLSIGRGENKNYRLREVNL